MKKVLVLLIPIFIGAALILGFRFFSSSRIEVAALQVTATPQAEVVLDDISLGKTPLYNDKLKPGEHVLKLVPQDSGLFNFEEKTLLRAGILTVLDRVFKSTEAESETSTISLERLGQKGAVEITVVSSPENADVKLDEQPQGVTPLLLKDVAVSDHQITITKDGYNTKTLRVRPTEGYRLTISVKLSILKPPSGDTNASLEEQREATKAAIARILQTPTGFLRVREEASVASKEITRVSPGDTFPLLETQENWFKIKLKDGKEGWISRQYATASGSTN